MKKIKDVLGQEIEVGDRVAMAQREKGGRRWQSVGIVEEISTVRKDGKPRKSPSVTVNLKRNGRSYGTVNTTTDPKNCLVKVTHCEKCRKPWRNSLDNSGHICE
jgi:hypothetical protein